MMADHRYRTAIKVLLMAYMTSCTAAEFQLQQQQQQQQHRLPRSLRHQAPTVITMSAAVPAPVGAAGSQPLSASSSLSSRKLQQIAGIANFAVGAGTEAAQRAINAGGALAALSNFYGIEGFGLRHRLGALPAPGGLELLLLAGPKALPGPEGFTAGFVGGTLEALAATANPITTAAIGSVLQDAAASSGLGQLVGATGLSGLGLQSGAAAMLADKVAGGALLNPSGKLGLGTGGLVDAGVQGKLLGEQGQLNAGVQGNVGAGMQEYAGAGLQGNPAAGVQGNMGVGVQNSMGSPSLQGDIGIASTPGFLGTSNSGLSAGGAAGAVMPEAGQAAGQTVGSTTGLPAAAGIPAQAANSSGDQVQVATDKGGGGGGLFKGAGSFLGRLTGRRGPPPAAAAAGSDSNTGVLGVQGSGNVQQAGDGMVSVTPGYHGGNFAPAV